VILEGMTLSGGLSLTPPPSVAAIEYLMVAGGGGSGNDIPYYGGGGGAGGLYYNASFSVSNGTTYAIVVGAGGALSVNGSNSSGFGATCLGGGAGGVRNTSTTPGPSGGAGGGAGAWSDYGNPYGNPGGAATQPTSATGGYGNAGSDGCNYNYGPVAGNGGGAGGAAFSAWYQLNFGPETVGYGGPGLLYSQFGMYGTDASNSTAPASGKGYFAGGGIGTPYTANPGVGGGGGIDTTNAPTFVGIPGATNTGGGAGTTSSGGSGIVLIRYLDNSYKTPSTTGSPTIITSGGYIIYAFTGSGSITF